MQYLICCLLATIIFPVLGDNIVELRARIYHVNGFYANFVQRIVDSSGSILQENCGELWIRYPYFFKYHVVRPEEYFVISNGETLWLYDPSVNQVIISWFKDVLENTVLMLLVNPIDLNLEKYHVNKNGDVFFVVPKDSQDVSFKQLTIQITNQGVIKNFSIWTMENQHISYQLTKHNIRLFDMDRFNFSLPSGVEVDEQRK